MQGPRIHLAGLPAARRGVPMPQNEKKHLIGHVKARTGPPGDSWRRGGKAGSGVEGEGRRRRRRRRRRQSSGRWGERWREAWAPEGL
jgi:hypothetical protein